jgi:hypothetical protein
VGVGFLAVDHRITESWIHAGGEALQT